MLGATIRLFCRRKFSNEMRTRRSTKMLSLAAACALAMGQSQAGDVPAGAGYRIPASTLDGGASQASEHVPSGYRVVGTIGQPDAAVSTAGTLRLEGGFWPAGPGEVSRLPFADGFE